MIKIMVKLASGQLIEEIVNKDSAIIGRSSKSDVVVGDDALSRSHCQVDYDGENFFITDLASANGVTIDGNKIEPNKRVKFSSFEEVQLGPHEISVVYEDVEQKPVVEKSSLKSNSRALPDKKSINKRAPIRNEMKKKYPLLNVLAMLLVGGAFYYHYKVSDKAGPSSPASSNVPAGVSVPDNFLTAVDYVAKDDLRSCSEANEVSCKELALNVDSGEGVLKEGQQVYLFIRPVKHLTNPKFEKIKQLEDKDSLVGVYLALKSPEFESFRKKDVMQIHLVLKNEQSRPYRVFRFHTKYYSLNGPEKARLITELITIFEGEAPAAFWNEASPIIQKLDL